MFIRFSPLHIITKKPTSSTCQVYQVVCFSRSSRFFQKTYGYSIHLPITDTFTCCILINAITWVFKEQSTANKNIVGFPVQEKPHLRLDQHQQPGKPGKSLIKDMQQEASPGALSHTRAWYAPLPCPWWHRDRRLSIANLGITVNLVDCMWIGFYDAMCPRYNQKQ